MSDPLTRVATWRLRAKELRAGLPHFSDPVNRAMILRYAVRCENAADRAALREAKALENYDEDGYYNPDPLGYFAARREHAWHLRGRGLTFDKIGERLGVTGSRCREMIYKHARLLRPFWPRRFERLEDVANG